MVKYRLSSTYIDIIRCTNGNGGSTITRKMEKCISPPRGLSSWHFTFPTFSYSNLAHHGFGVKCNHWFFRPT